MKPYCCPVCLGKGIVSGGFYNSPPYCDQVSTSTTEQCRQCSGQGIIWANDDESPTKERRHD